MFPDHRQDFHPQIHEKLPGLEVIRSFTLPVTARSYGLRLAGFDNVLSRSEPREEIEDDPDTSVRRCKSGRDILFGLRYGFGRRQSFNLFDKDIADILDGFQTTNPLKRKQNEGEILRLRAFSGCYELSVSDSGCKTPWAEKNLPSKSRCEKDESMTIR